MAIDNRRETLRIIGAVGVTCAFPFGSDELYGQHADHATLSEATLPAAPRFFSQAEYKVVARLADLIIPRTKTPGAVDAGVPAYIDFVVSNNAPAGKLCREGIAWLDIQSRKKHRKPFLELAEAQQVSMLEPLCQEADKIMDAPAGSGRRPGRRVSAGRMKAGVAFFRAVKGMTADGYYTSKTGLMEELGYNGNSVLAEFPPCTHEH